MSCSPPAAGPERDSIHRARLTALADIADASLSAEPRDQVLQQVAARIASVVAVDRCFVVLADAAGAQACAAHDQPEGWHRPLALERYPEIAHALRGREPVVVDDALRDPLLAPVREALAALEVRSILVQPMLDADAALGVIFLNLHRRAGAFGPDEVEFVRAAASTLANYLRDSRLHASLRARREELEGAYVDRYRELLEANKRLRELNKFKDETLAICSHDLRGPIQVLLGHARLLAEAELEKQDAASVQAVLRQGKKLLDLVQGVLDRARGDGARLALEPAELDLAAACREAVAEQELPAGARKIGVLVEAPERLSLIADRIKVRQVLQNLVAKAVERARDGGQVRLIAERVNRPDGEVARVSVCDDGPAIAPERLPGIFERPVRSAPEGGLGLAICRELVELHGGEIWAESDATGSCIRFTLPAADVRLPGQKLNPAPRSERARVLVVEDEPAIAAITAEILRSRYRVDLAGDGAEAVARARELHPDLVLMDVFLPKVDGLDAAVALKAAPDTCGIPLILVSAHRGVAEKVRALGLGAIDYLAKPFQAQQLLARVDAALANATRPAAPPPRGEPPADGLDAATGLPDAAGFARRFGQELQRARRTGQALGLLVLQPRAPLAAGADLASLATALRGALRADDVIGHLGEGRFALALPEANAAAVERLGHRLAPLLAHNLDAAFAAAGLDAAAAHGSAEELLRAALTPRPAA